MKIRNRQIPSTIVLAVVSVLCIVLALVSGTGYLSMRTEASFQKRARADFCAALVREMTFYRDTVLAGPGPAKTLDPDYGMAKEGLKEGFYYCLVAVHVKAEDAKTLASHFGLGLNDPSGDAARDKLKQAIDLLGQHGY